MWKLSYFTTDCLVGLVTRYYFLSEGFCLKVAVLSLWGALSDERMNPQFAVQSLNGPSRSEPITILYCLIWDSPQLWGLGCRNKVIINKVVHPGIGFPLHRLLRLAGLQYAGFLFGWFSNLKMEVIRSSETSVHIRDYTVLYPRIWQHLTFNVDKGTKLWAFVGWTLAIYFNLMLPGNLLGTYVRQTNARSLSLSAKVMPLRATKTVLF
jgi:hypothetical protein